MLTSQPQTPFLCWGLIQGHPRVLYSPYNPQMVGSSNRGCMLCIFCLKCFNCFSPEAQKAPLWIFSGPIYMEALRLFARAAKQSVWPDWLPVVAGTLGNQLWHGLQTSTVLLNTLSCQYMQTSRCLLGAPGLGFSYMSSEIASCLGYWESK